MIITLSFNFFICSIPITACISVNLKFKPKVSKSSTQVTIVNSLSPDQEVSCILKSLESFTPNPLVIYHDPCILNLARLKNDLVLSEIVRLPTWY